MPVPVRRTDEVAGFIALPRAAAMLGVSTKRVRQLAETDALDALALTTDEKADKAMIVLVSTDSIEQYLKGHPNRKRRGPMPGSGGRHKQDQGSED